MAQDRAERRDRTAPGDAATGAGAGQVSGLPAPQVAYVPIVQVTLAIWELVIFRGGRVAVVQNAPDDPHDARPIYSVPHIRHLTVQMLPVVMGMLKTIDYR